MLTAETAERLERIVGEEGMRLDPEQSTDYLYDVGDEEALVPDAILFPSEARQISAIMVLANREHIHVLPEGAGTRRRLPFYLERAVVLSTSKMGRIPDVDKESLKVTVEAGTTLKMLQERLDWEGLYFPPYPWCCEESTVGGCAADGIGGPASCRHGVFKQYVLGMEVVLPLGQVTRLGGQTVKNVVGYDLGSLFCGSEGSLGVIGKLTLRLLPKPREQRLLIMKFKSPTSACAAMKETMDAGRGPERICLLDNWMTRKMAFFSPSLLPLGQYTTVLCQVAGLKEVVESEADDLLKRFKKNGGTVIGVVRDPSEAEAIWHAQGACIPSLNDASPSRLTWDMIVPRSQAVAVMEKCEETAHRRQVELVHGGYYGNGIFHPVVLIPDHDETQRENAQAAFAELVGFARSVGGNGAGPFRRLGIEMAKFVRPDEGYMRHIVEGIKAALDPNGIMKPLPL